MRVLKSGFLYKTGILLLSLIIVVVGTSIIDQNFHIFTKLSNLPGEVAGVIIVPDTEKFINGVGGVNIVGAQATSPYQNVSGDVAISGNALFTGDIAVNGGDITTTGDLLLTAEASSVITIDNDGGSAGETFKIKANQGAGVVDLVTVKRDGKVGIGTANPGNKLEISSDTGSVIRLRNTNHAAGGFWDIGPDGANNFIIYKSGYMGPWTSGTSWNWNSDRRLKTDIQTLSDKNGLAAIKKLNPILFNWLDTRVEAPAQYGFIAQQVQGVFPELVSEGPDSEIKLPDGSIQVILKPLGLNYTGFIPSLVKAIQELAENFSALTQKVDTQQQEINLLKQEIEQLKAK